MNHDIKPCAECGRATRSPHSKFADFPDTIVRRGELCDSCWRCTVPVLSPAQHRAMAYHMAGLRSFLGRRGDRKAAEVRRAKLEAFLTKRIPA